MRSDEAETVERVDRLRTAAGATLKEKKRPIKVVAHDGTVKKVVPHVEVIEGLLHHEGITGELQAGIRPKTILCAVCKCVVEVPKSGGLVPRTCKPHRQRKLCPRGCGAHVKEAARCCRACVTAEERAAVTRGARTLEERSAASRRGHARRTPQERSGTARARAAAKTPEERSGAVRGWQAGRTQEQRIKTAAKVVASLTQEQRSERTRKAWETRRAKKAKGA